MTESKEERQYEVFVVNAADQDGPSCRGTPFTCKWNWIAAPADWDPSETDESVQAKWDAILVVAQKNQERETLALCKAIRENGAFDNISLLVAVNIYQMPLASKVKHLSNSSYVFTPIVEDDLLERFGELGTNE